MIAILEPYNLWVIVLGLAVLATSVLPRLLARYPFAMPMAITALGFAGVALPLGLEAPHPLLHGALIEHVTELGVIVALMGAGLKIDRKVGWRSWSATWRLVIVTMVLSIALSALLGWWVAAFAPVTAVLLGAVIAPTDPVLASELQVGAPGESLESGEDAEREVRFALTSEAGLNDGLAFPFTYMAIHMALVGFAPGPWIERWLLADVLFKIGVAVALGVAIGYVLARLLLALPAKNELAQAMVGLGALAATLLLYGVTEYAGGYGFLATFVGAVMIRNYERDHEHHAALHMLSEHVERLLTAVILVGFGGAIAGGLLAPLDWTLGVTAVLILLVVRPLAGVVGLAGMKRATWPERVAISFFGIRGVGSLYYLAYATNEAFFPGADRLWALVGLIILVSIFMHGALAGPVTRRLYGGEDRRDPPE